MSPRALLLSPDDQAVSAITGVLEELSVLCERPRDGATAAQKLNSQTYDLVLVDCDNLPAAKLIFDVCRRAHAGTSIPIAIVDGRAGLPTAFRLGAELILTKPVAKDQARSTIRTAVSRLKKEEPARPAPAGEPTPVEAPASTVPETLAQAAAVGAVPGRTAAIDLTPPPAPVVAEAPKAIPVPEQVALDTTSPIQIPESSSSRENSSRALAAAAVTALHASPKPSENPAFAELDAAEAEIQTPIFSYDQSRKPRKGRGALVALLLLGMAGASFYAAWMLQPEFRAMVQPQLDKAMAMVGMSQPPENNAPAKAVQPAVKASVPQTPAPTQDVSGSTAANPVAENATQPTALPVPVPTSTSALTSTPETTGPTTAPIATAPTAKAASTATDDSEAESSRKSAATPTQTELPWEKDTVILSSKGAEKRLVHHVPPAYTGAGRAQKIEGTVVLKTLVGGDGAVEGVRLIEGNPVLAPAATKAVKQWRYKPYIRDGSRTPFQTIVIVDFQRP